MPSYKQAYDKAGGAAKLGDYASWEKKAKAWNQKKYGTTEPTAKAKKMTGGSKQELAKAHSAASKPVQKKEAKKVNSFINFAPSETKVNQRMSDMVSSAGAQESLLDGKDRRKLERKARIQDRAEKRTRKSELKGTYGKDVGKAKFKAEYASAKQKSRAAKRTSKSESKSKSSASSANQDLAMQKIDSAVRKYSTK